jgi:hypothetical protein
LLRRRDFQREVLRDDRCLQPAKFRSGIHPQLIGEQRPRPLIGAEGFTLPAGAVKRQHQLAPSPLAQWCIGHRGLELADDLRGAAGGQQRIGPIFN